MVNIWKCTSCGHNLDEIWKDRKEDDKCPECGETLSRIDADMGTMDMIPRLFKYGGIALMLLAVGFVIFNLSGGGTRTSGILAVVIFIIAVIFFAVSIGLQYYLHFNAVKIEEERSRSRSTRKVKGRRGDTPRSRRREPAPGKKEKKQAGWKIPAGTGTKIPVGRKWGRN